MRPHEAHGFREDHAAPRSLAEFLARAGVRERYPHYDLGAAEARLLRATPYAPAPGHRARRRSAHGWSDPARDCPLDAERARRDLKAVCLAAVCAPKAETQLAAFVTGGHADLPGAVVFGCLLYLAGLREGAGFWWQFAAGSGSARTSSAAYCLFLDHSRRGEHHDARFWARELGRRGYRPGGRRDPREVRLCAQAAVLRYVDQLDDPDLGPVPLPRPGLTAVLAAFRPPAPVSVRVAAPRLSTGPLRHPALTAAARGTVVQAGTGEALAQARRALAVVRVLERHPLGVRPAQLQRESGLGAAALRPLLAMLCEEGYAQRPGAQVYARGPALDRLAAPGGRGLADQLQRTLSPARDRAGAAAVHLSRYAEGEAPITRMADGPGTSPVREWADFRAAAHAGKVGTRPLTRLDHDRRAGYVARHRPDRPTPRTITDVRSLFTALDALSPGAAVFDLREYASGVVCPAVPIAAGDAAGSLALSLPAAHAHRLRPATGTPRGQAVPVLLALLLSGAIPPDAPDSPDRPRLSLPHAFAPVTAGALTTPNGLVVLRA
ncbi:IclR family transcriptional regulator domain-containing protein [Streptomyces antarcticus]|uniref:IclR family transcriptional regulator domain-containing protein n=1 Tax=Streptomyces antarcticus TaxID=2996458 RepID=UPI00226EC0D1|nr:MULTISPECIES: IclR family transcriptional regulator C-terminal domain-containing protein [unclassified Streptomyces]MCY0940349.1 helix-turn-helix domain-containing protein [Streptomyces sp. H34-AA3]MCZ4087267.1 helix-turn-helix domain-containing protein [Streptomyces sp. H34-S5]